MNLLWSLLKDQVPIMNWPLYCYLCSFFMVLSSKALKKAALSLELTQEFLLLLPF